MTRPAELDPWPTCMRSGDRAESESQPGELTPTLVYPRVELVEHDQARFQASGPGFSPDRSNDLPSPRAVLVTISPMPSLIDNRNPGLGLEVEGAAGQTADKIEVLGRVTTGKDRAIRPYTSMMTTRAPSLGPSARAQPRTFHTRPGSKSRESRDCPVRPAQRRCSWAMLGKSRRERS